jgi:hypothetical protein
VGSERVEFAEGVSDHFSCEIAQGYDRRAGRKHKNRTLIEPRSALVVREG